MLKSTNVSGWGIHFICDLLKVMFTVLTAPGVLDALVNSKVVLFIFFTRWLHVTNANTDFSPE